MKKRIILQALFLCLFSSSFSQTFSSKIIINEIAPYSSKQKWVELRLCSGPAKDISGLYVTGYYGNEEKLSDTSITLLPEDNAVTPYDERFAVVYFGSGVDETDLTGDSNGNGILEVYTDSREPWGTEGAIALDDDAASENGMIDFVLYDCDGVLGNAVKGYASDAAGNSQWEASLCAVQVPKGETYMSIARKNADTDRSSDFAVSCVQTPGGENIFKTEKAASEIIRVKNKYLIEPHRKISGIEVNVTCPCELKLRVYSAEGMNVYESRLETVDLPGKYLFKIDPCIQRTLRSGIYIGHITGVSKEFKKAAKKKFIIVVGRYK